ncbi:hypothetical protein JCM11251_003430 [Rhodosporidiobolus azoricus]
MLSPPLHRQAVLWSLYRPLLRVASTLHLEHQHRLAVQGYVREEFKRNRNVKSMQRTQRKVEEGKQFLRDLERAHEDEHRLKRFRQLADYLLARRAVSPPPQTPKVAPPAGKPRLRPSILHSTSYHPPFQRLRPQPVGLSMMIFNRRRAAQRRFDKLALARDMAAYGQDEDALDAEPGKRTKGEDGWGKEWQDWIKAARRKEAIEFRRNEMWTSSDLQNRATEAGRQRDERAVRARRVKAKAPANETP